MNNDSDIANRLEYSVFRIQVSSDTRKNRDTIIRSKLTNLYPTPLDTKELLIVKNAEDRDSRIVFVCNSGFLKENKKIICPSLLSLKLLPRKTGVCVFISAFFIEYIALDRGRFVTSTLVSRNISTPLPDLMAGLPDNSIAIVSNKQDWEFLKGTISTGIQHYDVATLPPAIVRQSIFYKFSTEYHRKKLFLRFILFLLIILAGIGVVQQRIKDISESRMLERSKNETLQRLEEEVHQKEESLKVLQDEYLAIKNATLPDMFEVCSIVFSSIDTSTKIENITISGGKFQFDAHGNDAITILTRFEENVFISSINLNKVVVEWKGDYFTFNGEVKQRIILPNSDDSIDQKLAFYRSEIERSNQIKHIMRSRRSSEISKIIRRMLSHNRCQLESIQYYNTEYGLEIEYSIKAFSSAFFKFLQESVKSNEYLVISSVRIKSYLEGDSISAVIRFRSEIMLEDDDVDWDHLQKDGVVMTVDEMANYFVSDRKREVPLEDATFKIEVESNPTMIRNPGFLQYVGFAGTSGGSQFVLIKDLKKNSIIKLSNNSEQQDYFLTNSVRKLELKYEGNLYEVEK